MGKLKVVLSGIYYPVAIVRYFQSALLRNVDVELCTVGPYTGESIPWAGGMNVKCPLPPPDIRLPVGTQPPISYVEQLLPWVPDLWIQIDAAFHFLGRPAHGSNFFVGTDPHCIDYSYDRSQADLFFCMQSPYMKFGDVWLPYCYDPAFHYPEPNVNKIYDFGIVGADARQGPLYLPRQHLVSALRLRGYNVLQIFGRAYDDYRLLLNQCKVGLNWSTQKDTTARVFETMAMGCALLTNRTPDLESCEFVDGMHYEGFRDLDEALAKADMLMVNGTWSTRATAGHDAVRRFTYDIWAEYMLNEHRRVNA